MNDVQLLAHLLDMAGLETTPARELSHSLLDAHHDLEQVLTLPQDQLLGCPQLGESAATFLLLLPALMKRYTRTTAETSISLDREEDVQRLLAPHFRNQGFERVCAFLLGEGFQPFTSVLVGQGGRAAVTFSIRRVLDLALNHGAKGVILAHNHPDGVSGFSKMDLVSTGVLMRELAVVRIPLLDHFLLADDHIISMRQYVHSLRAQGVLLPMFPDWFPPEEAEV